MRMAVGVPGDPVEWDPRGALISGQARHPHLSMGMGQAHSTTPNLETVEDKEGEKSILKGGVVG